MTNRMFAREGEDWDDVRAEMEEAQAEDDRWDDRRNLRASYFAGEDVVRVAGEAFHMHMGDNAIYGPKSFASLVRYEEGVVGMALEMLAAPDGATGSVTTGGTESLVMAVKTARDWARETRPAKGRPEILVPRTAHPAFDKAAHFLDVGIRRISASVDFHADVAALAEAVTDNTFMIVGSAPPYPLGVVDPIPEIAALAETHGLWLHVDACIGGFVLPFVKDLGHDVPDFDFTVPGVCSMSADLHKYGYANRGSSILMLRDRDLSHYQTFSSEGWNAGLYATLNFAGSRAGGPVASAYAVMRYLGYGGYLERVERILAAKQRLFAGIEGIAGLQVWGRPQGGHFSFGSTTLDIFAVADGMEAKGWLFGRALDPAAMLLLLNPFHGGIVDGFLTDLEATVAAVKSGEIESSGSQAIYIV